MIIQQRCRTYWLFHSYFILITSMNTKPIICLLIGYLTARRDVFGQDQIDSTFLKLSNRY